MFEQVAMPTPGVFFQFVIEANGDYRFTQLGNQTEPLTGLSKDALLANADTLFNYIPKTFRQEMTRESLKSQASGAELHFIFPFLKRTQSGSDVWLEIRALPAQLPHGSVQWTGYIYDVTSREVVTSAYKEQAAAAHFILDNMLDAIITTDPVGTILYANSVAHELLGYNDSELVGHNVKVIIPIYHRVKHDNYMADYLRTGEAQIIGHHRRLEAIDKHGQLIPIELRINEFSGSGDFHFMGTIRDLRPQIENQKKLDHLKHRDLSTGLLNRGGLIEALNNAMSTCTTDKADCLTLLSIDVDDFHLLNNGFGTDAGDLIIHTIGKRLSNIGALAVARIHKDEFAILLRDSHGQSDILRHYEQIKTIIETPVHYLDKTQLDKEHTDKKLSFRITAGAVTFNNNEVMAKDLLHRSQNALGLAKKNARGHVHLYDVSQATTQRTSAYIDQRLKSADFVDELFLVFQPQFEASKGLIGYEALVRWESEGELISPDEFIPLAERNGAILTIGDWLIDQACQFIRHMPDTLRLSINISPKQFQQANFVDHIIEQLQHHNLQPSLLHLELTERLLIESVGDVIEKMTALNAAGITFSLDDFGTGYSSLSYLSKLPLSELKIDKSFIRHLTHQSGNYRIVESIISLSRSLGLNVIAEGVETSEEHELLQKIGCFSYQGYFFARPVRLNELLRGFKS